MKSRLAYTCLHFPSFTKTWQVFVIAAAFIAAILLVSVSPTAPNEGPDKTPGLLLSQSYFIDADGQFDFQQIKSARFTPFTGALSKGYSKGSVWLKLRIADAPNERTLAIMVEPPFLQRLELYDPARMMAAGARPVIGGRDQRTAGGSFDGITNGFVIPSAPSERDVYIRLESSTSMLAYVRVMPLHEAQQADASTLIVLAVYLALLAMFGIWGSVNFIIKRENIYLYFILRQLSSIAHAFAFFGLFRIFLRQDTSLAFLEAAYGIVIVTLITFNGLFDLQMISKFNPSRVLKNIYAAILSLPVVNVVLVLAGYNHEAIFLNQLMVNTGVIALFFLAWSAKGVSQSPMEVLAVKVIRVGYLITTITVLLPVVMYLNLLPGHLSLVKLVFIHAVVSSVVMLTLLMIESRNRELAFQEAQLEIQLKDVALQIENKRREDKERFLSMIIHELRNPLSVVRLLTDKATQKGQSVHQAVMDMTQLIERVEQSEKLESGDLLIEKERIDLVGIIQRMLDGRREGMRWEVSGPSQILASADPHLLKGILNNLFDNAEKYSPLGSKLLMSFEETSGSQPENIITISNEVDALHAPNRDRIFERYYRGSGAHHTPGSGLGLFLVNGWVEALGGSIKCSLSTVANNRSVFTVALRFAA